MGEVGSSEFESPLWGYTHLLYDMATGPVKLTLVMDFKHSLTHTHHQFWTRLALFWPLGVHKRV